MLGVGVNGAPAFGRGPLPFLRVTRPRRPLHSLLNMEPRSEPDEVVLAGGKTRAPLDQTVKALGVVTLLKSAGNIKAGRQGSRLPRSRGP